MYLNRWTYDLSLKLVLNFVLFFRSIYHTYLSIIGKKIHLRVLAILLGDAYTILDPKIMFTCAEIYFEVDLKEGISKVILDNWKHIQI